eukprot:3699319-Prymnesium_polylepis.1
MSCNANRQCKATGRARSRQRGATQVTATSARPRRPPACAHPAIYPVLNPAPRARASRAVSLGSLR